MNELINEYMWRLGNLYWITPISGKIPLCSSSQVLNLCFNVGLGSYKKKVPGFTRI